MVSACAVAVIAAWQPFAAGQSLPPQAAARRGGLPDPHGPSPLVYPPQRIALRMDHSQPAHRALRCTPEKGAQIAALRLASR